MWPSLAEVSWFGDALWYAALTVKRLPTGLISRVMLAYDSTRHHEHTTSLAL
jgi:hypothetical protein